MRDFAVLVTAPLAAGAAKGLSDAGRVAPNPAAGTVSVKGPFTIPTPVEIWDVLGRSVYHSVVTPDAQANLPVNVQPLPRGVYLLRVANAPQATRLILE